MRKSEGEGREEERAKGRTLKTSRFGPPERWVGRVEGGGRERCRRDERKRDTMIVKMDV